MNPYYKEKIKFFLEAIKKISSSKPKCEITKNFLLPYKNEILFNIAAHRYNLKFS